MVSEQSLLQWPRRVVLSRKGFDSATGGSPSPIFEDGRMISLPIPDRHSGISFKDVLYDSPYGKTVADLLPILRGFRHQPTDEVHLDPDLRREAIADRAANWRPIFGQCGGAQTHLDNRGVAQSNSSDLFLFYGYFRAVSSAFEKERQFHEGHVIFGWLQVGEKYTAREARSVLSWACHHPHLRMPAPERVRNDLIRRKRKPDNNTIFVARDSLSFLPSLPGGGVFPVFDKRLVLTKDPNRPTRRSDWVQLPCERTGHRQEHVLHVSESSEPKIRDWLTQIFNSKQAEPARADT